MLEQIIIGVMAAAQNQVRQKSFNPELLKKKAEKLIFEAKQSFEEKSQSTKEDIERLEVLKKEFKKQYIDRFYIIIKGINNLSLSQFDDNTKQTTGTIVHMGQLKGKLSEDKLTQILGNNSLKEFFGRETIALLPENSGANQADWKNAKEGFEAAKEVVSVIKDATHIVESVRKATINFENMMVEAGEKTGQLLEKLDQAIAQEYDIQNKGMKIINKFIKTKGPQHDAVEFYKMTMENKKLLEQTYKAIKALELIVKTPVLRASNQKIDPLAEQVAKYLDLLR